MFAHQSVSQKKNKKKTMLSVHAAQKCPLVSLTIFSGIKVRPNKQETVTLTFLCPVFKPFDFRNPQLGLKLESHLNLILHIP